MKKHCQTGLNNWGKVIMVDPKENDVLRDAEKKLSRKEKKFLNEFEEAVEFVNLHRQGKVRAITIENRLMI